MGDVYVTEISYTATSTLKMNGYDYSVENLGNDSISRVWVEGAEGDGIGEKVTLKMQEYGWFLPADKGFIETEDGWRLMTKQEYEENQKNEEYTGMSYYYYDKDEDRLKTYEEYLNMVQIEYLNGKDFIGWYNQLWGFYIVNGYAKNEKLFRENSRVKKLKLTIDGSKEYILELEDTMSPQLFDIDYMQEPSLERLNAIKAEFEILEVYKGEKYEDTVITTLKGAAGTNMNMGG